MKRVNLIFGSYFVFDLTKTASSDKNLKRHVYITKTANSDKNLKRCVYLTKTANSDKKILKDVSMKRATFFAKKLLILQTNADIRKIKKVVVQICIFSETRYASLQIGKFQVQTRSKIQI